MHTTFEIITDRVTHLESLEYQDDDEEEEERVELQENSEERDSAKAFAKKSLEIIDDMEKDVQKMRKNACQKDIRKNYLLYWNKIENETKNLDPKRFGVHNECKVTVIEMKAVLSETEMSGIKFDKEECQKTIAGFKSRLAKLA